MSEITTTVPRQVTVDVQAFKKNAIMAIILLGLGFYLIYPVFLILIQSFNTAPEILIGKPRWGLGNWIVAFTEPRLLKAVGNTMLIWVLVMSISFPIATIIAWTLARTKIPGSQTLEFMFWISYMMPGISTTIAWIGLMDPDLGLLNVALQKLPFIDQGPFNIFSVSGIVWGPT